MRVQLSAGLDCPGKATLHDFTPCVDQLSDYEFPEQGCLDDTFPGVFAFIITLLLLFPNQPYSFRGINRNKMIFWNFLLGVLLHCPLQGALAQLPTQPENCSGKSQISFSHSYKIDVPKSSQIKVDPDPRPLQDDSHTLLSTGEMQEGEEQNIIFRHNIRLQAPKGDCELLGQLKPLLERLEKIELEVRHLRGICAPQRCCGRAQGKNHVR